MPCTTADHAPRRAAISVLLFVAALAACAPSGTRRPGTDDDVALLERAQVSLQQGLPADAIAAADEVIAGFAARYPAGSTQRVYCSRWQSHTLGYLLSASVAGQDAIVIEPTWADAYLIKGFALVEMGQISAARDAVAMAVDLSPREPQYLSELGYTWQADKDWPRSLDLYQQAERAAASIEDPAQRNLETGRALRGQGFSLVELGRWDDAERAYLRCLEIDPKDRAAAGELEYVRAQRKAVEKR